MFPTDSESIKQRARREFQRQTGHELLELIKAEENIPGKITSLKKKADKLIRDPAAIQKLHADIHYWERRLNELPAEIAVAASQVLTAYNKAERGSGSKKLGIIQTAESRLEGEVARLNKIIGQIKARMLGSHLPAWDKGGKNYLSDSVKNSDTKRLEELEGQRDNFQRILTGEETPAPGAT